MHAKCAGCCQSKEAGSSTTASAAGSLGSRSDQHNDQPTPRAVVDLVYHLHVPFALLKLKLKVYVHPSTEAMLIGKYLPSCLNTTTTESRRKVVSTLYKEGLLGWDHAAGAAGGAAGAAATAGEQMEGVLQGAGSPAG